VPIALALAVALAVQPSLPKLALKPAQVGPGYVLVQRSDGHGTAQRTLDLCGTNNYPSESLRTARLQLNYLKPKGQYAISNEVVTYKAGGAAQAMRELAQHAAHCPNKPIAVEGQPAATYRITRITDSKLIKGYIAVQIRTTATVNGKKVSITNYAIYQRVGNVFSGVYSYGASTPEQELLCLHAAEASAKNLRAGGAAGGIPA
jgi:hypothetical protein